MDRISRSTNYVDQLDKPQSVSLRHLALWRVIKEHRREHPDYKLRIHVAKVRNILKIYVNWDMIICQTKYIYLTGCRTVYLEVDIISKFKYFVFISRFRYDI